MAAEEFTLQEAIGMGATCESALTLEDVLAEQETVELIESGADVTLEEDNE